MRTSTVANQRRTEIRIVEELEGLPKGTVLRSDCAQALVEVPRLGGFMVNGVVRAEQEVVASAPLIVLHWPDLPSQLELARAVANALELVREEEARDQEVRPVVDTASIEVALSPGTGAARWPR